MLHLVSDLDVGQISSNHGNNWEEEWGVGIKPQSNQNSSHQGHAVKPTESSRLSVLAVYCCYNQSPQTQQFKTTRVYCFTVLEVRSLKWVSLGYSQVPGGLYSFLEALRETPLAFFCQLLASSCLNPRFVATFCLQSQQWLAESSSYQVLPTLLPLSFISKETCDYIGPTP